MNGISPTERTWAQIDLSALLSNFNLARAHGKQGMCVIKADAYGHGAVRCGLFLEQHGANAFAVACLSEALELRAGGLKAPILILGYTPAEHAQVIFENGLVQTVVDESHARELSAAACGAGAEVLCHVKLDTGMGRAGVFAQGTQAAHEAALAVERIMRLPGLRVKGMYTHFSVADTPEEDDYTAWQLQNYNSVLEELTAKGLRPETCHTSNSACILKHPETIVDMVREGIMLYGLYPDSVPQQGPLKPVMTLKTRVSQVRDFPAGASVSYGRMFRGGEAFTTAVLLAGYADGYPRRLSNSTRVVIGGESYPQAGRICMDMSMALVDKTRVKRGDEVTLIGGAGISWEEAAVKVGTINYELTCLVTVRARRVYTQ